MVFMVYVPLLADIHCIILHNSVYRFVVNIFLIDNSCGMSTGICGQLVLILILALPFPAYWMSHDCH